MDTAPRGVERINDRGIVQAGQEYPLDVLIYATGFQMGSCVPPKKPCGLCQVPELHPVTICGLPERNLRILSSQPLVRQDNMQV